MTPQTKRHAPPAPRRVLDAKPLRLLDATPRPLAVGQWRLTVPVKSNGLIKLLVRRPAGLTKTFELDDLGKAVWDGCDGRTSVRELITALAARYGLNVREVEVATLAFLRTLVRKGLVGVPAEESR